MNDALTFEPSPILSIDRRPSVSLLNQAAAVWQRFTSSREREAAALLALAESYEASQPSFAADLRAAAMRAD